MATMDSSQIEQSIRDWTHEVNYDRKQLLVVMQKIQESYHYISEESMRILAEDFQIQPAEVFSLATFFPSLHNIPEGKYHFKLCNGLLCNLHQKEELITTLQNKLGVKFGETSRDGQFSLEYSQCMGMCDQGPVLSINDQIFTKITLPKLENIITFCNQNQNIEQSLFQENDSLGIWSGRSETITFAPILQGSVLSRFNTCSHENLLDELEAQKLISEELKQNLDPTTDKLSTKRVLVCNTDLPQAGSFKERIFLADHYDLFLEALIAIASISGVHEGIIFLRPEHEALRPVLSSYLEGLKLLADNICNIEIRTSPGFIAGGIGNVLEVAVNSNRFPENSGGSPSTSIIEIDTTTLLEIGRYLSGVHCQEKTQNESSTRIFAISGDCSLPGVYEMPVNASISDLIQISGGQSPKAVQVGGIFGQFVLPAQFNDPVPTSKTYGNEEANIIVYGPNTDFHEVAIKLLQFNVLESCGQCAPCREGSARLLEKFQKRNKNQRLSTAELYSVADCMQLASKCQFGRNATTGFLSLIQNFSELI
jgi:[NiFe] hydrogenase diaphorase moiety large subunit